MPKYAVVDSQFLFDIQDGDSVAEEVLFQIRVRGFVPSITPTTGHELIDMSVQDKSSEAMVALESVTVYPDHSGIFYPTLDADSREHSTIRVRNGHAMYAAEELIQKGILPEEEKNLALIIAESACIPARYVILDSYTFKKIDPKAINKVLSERDLATIIIIDRLGFLKSG